MLKSADARAPAAIGAAGPLTSEPVSRIRKTSGAAALWTQRGLRHSLRLPLLPVHSRPETERTASDSTPAFSDPCR
jgi:hypothetical protein